MQPRKAVGPCDGRALMQWLPYVDALGMYRFGHARGSLHVGT
jgi:hypothetical protein